MLYFAGFDRTRATVREITINDKGLADGALYYDAAGKLHEQKARIVIVGCNAIGTARLLLVSKSSKFPNGVFEMFDTEREDARLGVSTSNQRAAGPRDWARVLKQVPPPTPAERPLRLREHGGRERQGERIPIVRGVQPALLHPLLGFQDEAVVRIVLVVRACHVLLQPGVVVDTSVVEPLAHLAPHVRPHVGVLQVGGSPAELDFHHVGMPELLQPVDNRGGNSSVAMWLIQQGDGRSCAGNRFYGASGQRRSVSRTVRMRFSVGTRGVGVPASAGELKLETPHDRSDQHHQAGREKGADHGDHRDVEIRLSMGQTANGQQCNDRAVVREGVESPAGHRSDPV